MTIAQPVGAGPISNVGIAPIGGGGLKSILIDIGLTVAETVITNYVNSQINAVSKKAKTAAGQVVRKTLRFSNKRNRTRYYSNTRSSYKRYRGRRLRPRRRY